MRLPPSQSLAAAAINLTCAVLLVGCGDQSLAPVKGKVFLDGSPLKFGSVTMQPQAGRPATSVVQPDGTFVMKTGTATGASIGENQVRITCYESQNPNYVAPVDEPPAFGKLLIPERYTKLESSRLSVSIVSAGVSDLELHLTSQAVD